jgi:tRNA-dihydrouridine synthase
VADIAEAYKRAEETGADGIMLGRAIFGNPWLLNPHLDHLKVPIEDRLRVMLEHARLFEELLPFKSFSLMKKHYKAYVNHFESAKELRMELMETKNSEEAARVVNRFLKNRATPNKELVQ